MHFCTRFTDWIFFADTATCSLPILFTQKREPKFPIEAMYKITRGYGYNRGELISAPQPGHAPSKRRRQMHI